MTWSEFYLVCFLVGFSLSVLSFFAGAVHLHLPFRIHLPFQGHHVGHAHGMGAGSHGLAKGGTHIPWFNAMTLMTFLAWFGGAGYILTQYSHFVAVLDLAIAIIAGLFASTIVFKFMVKLIRISESHLNDIDYRLEGSVGTITSSIRENGTGEITYALGGARRCSGARTEDGAALEKGAEVVITRYEKGIAYVKRWEEFTQ